MKVKCIENMFIKFNKGEIYSAKDIGDYFLIGDFEYPKYIFEIMEEEKTETQEKISKVCDEIKEMLIEKNRKYGDSALNPIRIFAKSDTVEQLKVRIDDKLNRLKNIQNDDTEDVINDLVGYLILLKVAEEEKK